MINVTKTYLPDREKYINYVNRIYNSGWLTNNGQLVQELERRLAQYLGVKHIVLVSNGTLALQIAFRALGLSGDVITTPFSFVATTSSLVWEGLNPVFTDIDPNTYNMDPAKIESKITDNTSAIVPVHVFGNCCDVEEIGRIAKKHSLRVVYDAAHAFGVKYRDRSIAEFGDISTFSFHSTKIFHTIEGGGIAMNDEELYKKCKLLINFGIPGPDRIIALGINAKMNEFQAAMGLCMLDEMEQILENRKKVYERYIEGFSGIPSVQLQQTNNDATRNYSYFPVVFKSEDILLDVSGSLKVQDITPRRYFYPSLEELPYLRDKQTVPVSSDISKRILCLPIFESLPEDKQAVIIKTVIERAG